MELLKTTIVSIWFTARKRKLNRKKNSGNALYTSFYLSDKSEPVCQSSHYYESTMSLTMKDHAFLVNVIMNMIAINRVFCKVVV